VALQVINTLKVLTYPFLPFAAERLHAFLGFKAGDGVTETYSGQEKDGVLAVRPKAQWLVEEVPAGQKLNQPQILFNKLDEKVAEEEKQRLLDSRKG
jgi:methionyl-tRNA synthetase